MKNIRLSDKQHHALSVSPHKILKDMPNFLVYDRTQQNKGKFNLFFLNRVEEWTEYLARRLREQGYRITVQIKKDWAKADFPTRPEVDRIRTNVEALQEGFYSLPDWREIVYNNTMDFNQANALEWDLQTIYNWLMRMVAAFVYCGELHAGEV